MKITVWVVSKIDCYAGYTSCQCTFRNYNGVEVFTSLEEAEEFGMNYEKKFAADYEIDEREIEVKDFKL